MRLKIELSKTQERKMFKLWQEFSENDETFDEFIERHHNIPHVTKSTWYDGGTKLIAKGAHLELLAKFTKTMELDCELKTVTFQRVVIELPTQRSFYHTKNKLQELFLEDKED